MTYTASRYIVTTHGGHRDHAGHAGVARERPLSGYDIKAIVDRSTRFFWAASYGQIYPELRRLEAEGLVEGEDAPNGGRPPARLQR